MRATARVLGMLETLETLLETLETLETLEMLETLETLETFGKPTMGFHRTEHRFGERAPYKYVRGKGFSVKTRFGEKAVQGKHMPPCIF